MFNRYFYLVIAAVFVLGQLAPPRRRCAWFGALNLLALYTLFGWPAALVLVILALALWTGLTLQVITKSKGILAALYGGAGALFLLQKTFIDSSPVVLQLREEFVQVPHLQGLATVLVAIATSYVFMRVWDVIRSVSDGDRLLDPLSLTGYLLPFFMVWAGPVNVYGDHVAMDDAPAPSPEYETTLRGVELIVSGLFLKLVIAEGMRLWLIGMNAPWPTARLVDSALIVIYVYFDFWGYSRVALGAGLLLSIPTPVNFRAPLASTSITEFWTRWHVSLGDFVRKNIFTPLQVQLVRRFGVQRAHYTNVLALMVSFGFVGLWHRLSGLFLLWGLLIGLVMVVEKRLLSRHLPQWRRDYAWATPVIRIAGPIYVFAVIVATLHLVMPELIGAPR